MSERTRTLRNGGLILALLVAGLVAGFLVLQGDADTPSSPTETPVTAATPTVPATETPADPRAQVEQAYLHAWDVWAEGLLELDPSRLPEVFSGRALSVIQRRLEQQRRDDQPVRLRATHDYRIEMIDATTASVDDRYVNHSVRLDPETLEPIEKDPKQKLHTSFTLRLVDGTWKIAEIIEYE